MEDGFFISAKIRMMKEFTEKTHALIAGLYYRELCALDPEKGKEAFRKGTILHGESRGKRMAAHALKDGESSDFRGYFRYGEWRPSEYSQSLQRPKAEVLSYSPDYVIAIPNCLWHDQFQEMGLSEAEEIYCAEIDKAIVHGFSPELEFVTEQTLRDHSCCIQRACGACLNSSAMPRRKEEYVRDFGFHCANSFYAYKKAAELCFPEKGEEIAEKVMKQINEQLGAEASALLSDYENYDFEKIEEDRV